MPRREVQPLMRDALVAVWREAKRDIGQRLTASRGELGRQGDGEVRAFDEVLLLLEEVVQHVGERGVGGAEAHGEEVVQGTGDLVGYGGGDHVGWRRYGGLGCG